MTRLASSVLMTVLTAALAISAVAGTYGSGDSDLIACDDAARIFGGDACNVDLSTSACNIDSCSLVAVQSACSAPCSKCSATANNTGVVEGSTALLTSPPTTTTGGCGTLAVGACTWGTACSCLATLTGASCDSTTVSVSQTCAPTTGGGGEIGGGGGGNPGG